MKKEIRKQCKLERNALIAIGLSGGKDSTVTLHLLNEIFKRRKGIELHAITVNEGIAGYRPYGLKIAKATCKRLGIEHHTISFKERIGYALDEILEFSSEVMPCSFCGVLRRWCLNIKAKELNADRLATGLNLDDTAQSILMNFTRGDVEKLARLGPHNKIQKGLVPRIQPLRLIPEKEVYLYAMLNGIRFYRGECPYSTYALRNRYRSIINELEENSPGTRHAILRSYDNIADLLAKKYPPARLLACEICGEPTSQNKCKACVLIEKIKTNERLSSSFKSARYELE